MKVYVDTSVLVRIFLHDEPDADQIASTLFDPDTSASTSDLTRIEFASALQRAVRSGRIPDATAHLAAGKAAMAESGPIATVVLDIRALEAEALRVVQAHALAAADALHVATAIGLRRDGVAMSFFTRDRRQAEAARSEGFEII